MIAGFGNMGRLIAERVLEQSDMELLPVALELDYGQILVPPNFQIKFVSPQRHEETIIKLKPDVVVIFSVSEAVIAIMKLCAKLGVPCVVGTTGVDRKLMKDVISGSYVSAVIAPNMGIPIVLLQNAIENVARAFPDSLKGYSLKMWESHQASKPDTSGTARALVQSFNLLGIPFKDEQIEKVRIPGTQELILRVPKDDLNGHAIHHIEIGSPEGDVVIEIKITVLGRKVYVEGVLWAIRFLIRNQDIRGATYNMFDVLSETV